MGEGKGVPIFLLRHKTHGPKSERKKVRNKNNTTTTKTKACLLSASEHPAEAFSLVFLLEEADMLQPTHGIL